MSPQHKALLACDAVCERIIEQDGGILGGVDFHALRKTVRAALATQQGVPRKMPIPPAGAEPEDVIYAEGWNGACDAFFGGLPPHDPIVIEITHTQQAVQDDVLEALELSPESFRSEGGIINKGKLRAAILHPYNYLPPDHWMQARFSKPGGRPQAVQGEPVAVAHKGRHVGSAGVHISRLAALDELPDGVHKLYTATPPAPGQVERDREDAELLRRALYYLEADAAGRYGVQGLEEMVRAGDHPVVADLRKRLGGSARFPDAARSSEGGGNV
jgi:hypothetical protein